MANTQEIIKQFREKMREYYPEYEYKVKNNIITKDDDDFLEKILIALIDCFSTSEEEAKKLSRKVLDKEIAKYELKILNG